MPSTLPDETLAAITRRAIAAAGHGDLDAVGRALAEREAAIAAAAPWEPAYAPLLAEIIKDGETLGRLLAETKRNIVAEHSRLEQLRAAFLRNRAATSINLEA